MGATKKLSRTKKLLLSLGGLILLPFLCEGILWTGAMDGFSTHWVPAKDQELDRAVNLANAQVARRHPFRFNDLVRAQVKPDGTTGRIAVMGDDFVWGNGLPYGETWGHKLERMVSAEAPAVEVMSWGRNGWSTRDQLNFLKLQAEQQNFLEVDHLLIGFAADDLDLGARDKRQLDWKGAIHTPTKILWPRLFGFVTGQIDGALARFSEDYGQDNWIKFLWSDENYGEYEKVLLELKSYLDAKGLPYTFVMTPNAPMGDFYEEKYARITATLKKLGIPYLNLYPTIEKHFAHTGTPPYRTLWANPANSHMGSEVATASAEKTLAFLKDQGILERLARGKPGNYLKREGDVKACPPERTLRLIPVKYGVYRLGETRYLQFRAVALEEVGQDIKVVKTAYLALDDKLYPTFYGDRSVLQLDGKQKVVFNGGFVADIPLPPGMKQAKATVFALTEEGCVRRFSIKVPLKLTDEEKP